MASVNCSNAHAVCTPHPFAKANARALQSFEKENHKCPMVGKKQGVQIPCGHMVRKEADFALLGLSKNY